MLQRLAAEGLVGGHVWANGPGERYGEHEHGHPKVLVCVSGSVVFSTPDGEVPLGPGDRLELPPHTRHSALVGPDGVHCAEARRPPDRR